MYQKADADCLAQVVTFLKADVENKVQPQILLEEAAARTRDELEKRMELLAKIREITNTLPEFEEIPKDADGIDSFFTEREENVQETLRNLTAK